MARRRLISVSMTSKSRWAPGTSRIGVEGETGSGRELEQAVADVLREMLEDVQEGLLVADLAEGR
jgi:hypothetical protein